MAHVSKSIVPEMREVTITQKVDVTTYHLNLTEEEAIALAAYTGLACCHTNRHAGPQTSSVFSVLRRALGDKYRSAVPDGSVANHLSFRSNWR